MMYQERTHQHEVPRRVWQPRQTCCCSQGMRAVVQDASWGSWSRSCSVSTLSEDDHPSSVPVRLLTSTSLQLPFGGRGGSTMRQTADEPLGHAQSWSEGRRLCGAHLAARPGARVWGGLAYLAPPAAGGGLGSSEAQRLLVSDSRLWGPRGMEKPRLSALSVPCTCTAALSPARRSSRARVLDLGRLQSSVEGCWALQGLGAAGGMGSACRSKEWRRTAEVSVQHGATHSC